MQRGNIAGVGAGTGVSAIRDEDWRQQRERARPAVESQRREPSMMGGRVVAADRLPTSAAIPRQRLAQVGPRQVSSPAWMQTFPSQQQQPQPQPKSSRRVSQPFPNPYSGTTMPVIATQSTVDWRMIPRPRQSFPTVTESPAVRSTGLPMQVAPSSGVAQIPQQQSRRDTGKAKEETVTEDYAVEEEEESDVDTRWTSEESGPALSRRLARQDGRRRSQESAPLKPVRLMLPTASTSARPLERTSSEETTKPRPMRKPVPPIEEKPTSPVIKLSDGRQIPTVRTDFANLKKISRPSSRPANPPVIIALSSEKMESPKQMQEQEKRVSDLVVARNSLAPALVQAASQFQPSGLPVASMLEDEQEEKNVTELTLPEDCERSHRNTFGPGAAGLLPTSPLSLPVIASQLPRMSTVEEEDEAATDKTSSLRSQREGAKTVSLHRSSIDSGTTVLDTPVIEQSAYFEPSMREGAAGSRPSRRPRLSALVAPPSAVAEGNETKSTASGTEKAEPGKDRALMTQLDQLQQLLKDDRPITANRPNTANRPLTGNRPNTANRSDVSRLIPIVNAIRGRRPGTANSRFSEGVSVAHARLTEADHGNKPICPHCFRAGFDCAMHLQLGEGTAGRKAFQDFLAMGGLEGLSMIDDDGKSKQTLDQGFMDKLGEVAFGESALSRPVTRGVVNDMLRERGEIDVDNQQGKTVEEVLLALYQLKQEQEEQEAVQGVRTLKEVAREVKRSRSARFSTSTNRPRNGQQADVALSQGGNSASPPGDDQEQQRSSSSASSDQLPYMRDRWSMLRKALHIGVLGVFLFALQCLDAGYRASIPSLAQTLNVEPASMLTGRMSFILGEAAGLPFAASLSAHQGRHRLIVIAVFLQGILCTGIGFVRNSNVITIIRGMIGYASGIFILATLGTVLDLMTTRHQRAFALVCVLLFAVAGQLAGPWIAALVIHLTDWTWLYRIMAIFAAVYGFIYGIALHETQPECVFRELIVETNRRNEEMWTPTPRPRPTLKSLLRDHCIRPYGMLFTHGAVSLCGTLLAFFLGSLVLAFTALGSTLVERHSMSPYLASVTMTTSASIGVLVATAFMCAFPEQGLGHPTSKGRTRHLSMDEKGLIDATRPTHNAEDMLRPACGAVLAGVIALYTLALTSTVTSWLFSALSLTLLCAAIVVLVVSILNYLFETYYPAAMTVLGELIAVPEDQGPAPLLAKTRKRSWSSTVDQHTLMSGGDEDGKRWSSQWALCATASVGLVALFVAGIMTTLGMIATNSLPLPTLLVIAASACLGVSIIVLLLYRFGRSLRHAAFLRIARKEQAIWRRLHPGSTHHSAAAASGGDIYTHRNGKRKAPVGVRLRELLLLRKGGSQDNAAVRGRAISDPYNFVHVATAAPRPLMRAFSRRSSRKHEELQRPLPPPVSQMQLLSTPAPILLRNLSHQQRQQQLQRQQEMQQQQQTSPYLMREATKA